MIELRNLNFRIGKKAILEDISLTLEKGKFYALMGMNGSGKSTLLKCMSGLHQVQTSSVYINQKEIHSYRTKELARNIAFLFQRQTLFLDFSVYDMVMLGRYPHQKYGYKELHEDREVVEESLRLSDTWHLKDSRMNTLSGGEFQRVMLARSIAQRTPILFLDEPLANLDIAHQFELINSLRQMNKKEGKTIILVIHDLSLAYSFFDHFIFLKQGKLAFVGKKNDAFSPSMIQDVFSVSYEIVKQTERDYLYCFS